MTEFLSPLKFDYSKPIVDGGLLVLASGFEYRDKYFLKHVKLGADISVVIVDFKSNLDENEISKTSFEKMLRDMDFVKNVDHVDLDTSNPHLFESKFTRKISSLPLFSGRVYIDISGFPSHASCSVLSAIREHFPTKITSIIYTSAEQYFPTEKEYRSLNKGNYSETDEIDYVPPTMALEMSDNLIPKRFCGHRSKNGVTCLVLFAGYEVHRSSGVIENINPSKLLLLYGSPGGEGIDWRCDFSKRLHLKYEASRNTAVEKVSTLDVRSSLKVLEEYYDHLFDDHDISIAPVCSKMQTVAAYLFWEKYREIQLVFPMPIGYNPKRAPKGAEMTYLTLLPPISALHSGNYPKSL